MNLHCIAVEGMFFNKLNKFIKSVWTLTEMLKGFGVPPQMTINVELLIEGGHLSQFVQERKVFFGILTFKKETRFIITVNNIY